MDKICAICTVYQNNFHFESPATEIQSFSLKIWGNFAEFKNREISVFLENSSRNPGVSQIFWESLRL